MLQLTLDTNCVIHAAQSQEHRADIDRLIEFAQAKAISLSITTAFDVDQASLAPDDERRVRNLKWLSE